MKQTIHLALTHDWELRGNGSGDIEQIQFAPLRRLLQIYASAGIRTTIMPDLMQQLTFRAFELKHPELKNVADEWDEHVREAFRQGHDVQLHIHPQWINANYLEGKWQLKSDWSLLNYDKGTARQMIEAGKRYLEDLLKPLDRSFECRAFRAGALAIAPSKYLLGLLIELGIHLDVSVAGGLYFDTRNLTVDFRNSEEDFLPFYPELDDARKVSQNREAIICVPIHHFRRSRRQTLLQQYAFLRERISSRNKVGQSDAGYSLNEWGQKGRTSLPARIYDKGIAPYFSGEYVLSDTARLNRSGLAAMLRSIREKATMAQMDHVPVILTNHPKEITDFEPIEQFVREVAQSEDIEFITLTKLVRGLESGEFVIRQKS